jgi:putative DNA primase/helicase
MTSPPPIAATLNDDEDDFFGDLRPILDDDLDSFVREQDRHRSLTVVREEGDRDIIGETRRWLDKLKADTSTVDTCTAMHRAVERWADGSRENQLRGALAVVRLDERGHHGLAAALDQLWRVRAKSSRDFQRIVEFAHGRVITNPAPPNKIGCRCPNASTVWPSPAQPLAVARQLLSEKTSADGHLLLRRWRGDFWSYSGPAWHIIDPESLRKWLYERLEHVKYKRTNPNTGKTEQIPWSPDKPKVDKVLDAMIPPTLLDATTDAPIWLSTGKPATGYVPCLNGLVNVQTQKITPCTPHYFGTVAIPVTYNPDVGPPLEWLKFLRTLWPDLNGEPAGEIRALQQWFGYVLSGRLELQKMLLVVGPPRCGKGTIARILRDLVGAANTSAPTLAGIAQNFGLETSIGKSLMIVGDARLSQQGQETVVERLLSISGEDTLTLDRKNKTAWTGTMQTRVMILSNELPRFVDASGAIASRFIILKLNQTFLGREDTKLETRLREEFPAILKWALDGLTDLNEAERMHQPPSHLDAMQEMYDLVSPISSFLRDVCGVGDECAPDQNGVVAFAELYAEYEKWCKENGRHAKNTAGFSADLKTQMPELKTDVRPRNAAGRKLPRHVRGLTLSGDWTGRVRSQTSNHGDDNWHLREPPEEDQL